MMLMASAGFGLSHLADNPGLTWLAYNVDHVAWEGFSLWDLIQPNFIFIVGAAMPFAFAIRSSRGQSHSQMLWHAFKRSLTLIIIGTVIVSIHKDMPQIDLITVLQQIGIAYFFAFFVLGKGIKVQLSAALAILIFHSLCFFFGPGAGIDPWAKNANFGSWLEMLLFGRLVDGGYLAFNAVSSIATVIFGIIAGEMMLVSKDKVKTARNMLLIGLAMLAIGWALSPLIPIVKRIWTASWAIFAGGWAYIFMALCYWLIEVKNRRGWTFIFKVIGMNSIAIYVFYQMIHWRVHEWLWVFTRCFLEPLGDGGIIIQSVLVMAIQWYFVYWLYKRKIFLKVG